MEARKTKMRRDFLDEVVEERTKKNAKFPELVGEAAKKRALGELTAAWSRAKVAEETAKREAARLRDEILEAGAKIGYEDEHLVIGATSDLDLEDKRLEQALRDVDAWEQAHESKLSTKKLRALAELHASIAKALDAATTSKPRFEQVSKKK
jgi:hypothetical protein